MYYIYFNFTCDGQTHGTETQRHRIIGDVLMELVRELPQYYNKIEYKGFNYNGHKIDINYSFMSSDIVNESTIMVVCDFINNPLPSYQTSQLIGKYSQLNQPKSFPLNTLSSVIPPIDNFYYYNPVISPTISNLNNVGSLVNFTQPPIINTAPPLVPLPQSIQTSPKVGPVLTSISNTVPINSDPVPVSSFSISNLSSPPSILPPLDSSSSLISPKIQSSLLPPANVPPLSQLNSSTSFILPTKYYCPDGHPLEWMGEKFLFRYDIRCNECLRFPTCYNPIRWKCKKCDKFFCTLCYKNKVDDFCPIGHPLKLKHARSFVCDSCYEDFKDENAYCDYDCNLTFCEDCFDKI